MDPDELSGEYLDAISNLVYIGYLLKLNKDRTLDKCLKKDVIFTPYKSIVEFLENLVKKFEENRESDSDLSILIGKAEISLALLLITPTNKAKVASLKDKVIKQYQDVFELIYSPRYIKIEIKQIQCIRALIITKDKSKLNALESIEKSLTELLKE